MTYFLTIVFILIAVLLTLVVLMQRGRGGGLSGAFGAGGGSGSAFGTKTGDVFTWVTVILFAVFMGMAIWLNYRFQATVKPAKSEPAKVLNTGAGQASGSLETSAKSGTSLPALHTTSATGAAGTASAPAKVGTPAASTTRPK